MSKITLQIAKPQNFNFQRTVLSHGWYSLLPFELDKGNWILKRVFTFENAAPISAQIYESENQIEISANEKLNQEQANKIVSETKHILQLDENLDEFYELVKFEPEFAWISERGAGRLLRSPTVYEDLVKSICTTNCSWALTRNMIVNLVEKLGVSTNNGERKSFPTAATMAAQTHDFYKNEIRAGYRSAYLKELAERAASGNLDIEAWATSTLPTIELKKQIKQVKGVGNYAAENLLKLLGHYDGLALDSYLRMRFANKHNHGESCPDKQIYDHYERFGIWRGLALWCDMTEDWL
jgi:N-glycosylase/DNA lyase